MEHHGGDADEASAKRVLKRKVKNPRTNLFEWVKYRCHVGDGFFLCEKFSPDTETASLRVLLANILSVHPKAASRFEITHATPNGHISTEFMAPTTQHCALWVRTLKEAIAEAVQVNSTTTSCSVPPTTQQEQPPLQQKLPPLESQQINTPHALLSSAQSAINCQSSNAVSTDNFKISSGTFQPPTGRPDLASEEISTHLRAKEHCPPVLALRPPSASTLSPTPVSNEPNPVTIPSRHSTPPAVSQLTASEHEAEEQLGILVRVESVLKQLELENKLCLERETQLRQELANMQDSMRLMEMERQELLTQLRDVTTEREEWKAVARRKQSEMTQVRDDLQIARDEIRLLTNEQLRLHHRNKDLAVHVQRLDTLVYGKF
ncbi:hypothetical protein H310_00216 [Aphanomyces invadans]|uniref:PH domain-containing protein n=1 Tax=Aphanomyces invadans TaxID=157072 RepID=A0A024UVN4_9STRA|nr:hypothetical protein H310_00216 [Aphanomyces invadans]ETW09723.1 hypothetical protein H310_00216 [Aphanomyces invadans]|eukprot:XP_008861134.1 hypothetical protein H310_00216 [Aphanomyces invadans]